MRCHLEAFAAVRGFGLRGVGVGVVIHREDGWVVSLLCGVCRVVVGLRLVY